MRHALIWGAAVALLVPGLLHAQASAPADAAPGAPIAPTLPPASRAPQAPAVSPLELRRQGDALELSARLRFDLPESVEDALYKGLSVIFTAEVEVYRERWWWLDARISRVQRQWRLVYQPLTERWRLSLGASSSGKPGGVALAQFFESLDEALAVIQHIAQWRVADGAALEPGDTYRVEFHFHLDTDKLPRPLQIGALGDDDWQLDLNRQRTFTPEKLQ